MLLFFLEEDTTSQVLKSHHLTVDDVATLKYGKYTLRICLEGQHMATRKNKRMLFVCYNDGLQTFYLYISFIYF